MKIVDINLLLYAVNRSAAQHRAARAWWEAALQDDEPVGLAWVVVLGFLRLSTNPRVFANPLTIAEAAKRVEAWLAQPDVEWIVETDEHWRLYRELILECGTGGNLTTDAHLAALAISNGATLYSCDTDFVRFKHLKWIDPLALDK